MDESENTVPTLTKTDTKVAVTEAGVDASNAAVAGDPAANGSLAATDMEQTAAGALGIQGCADTVAGTACASFRDGTATGLGIDGIYGSFTLTAPANSNSFTWTYALDNQCGTTPGIQGTTTDAGEADDPGCATDALAAGATATETLRVRADDNTSNPATRYSTALAVTVTITGANDAPVAGVGIPATINATEGEVFNFMLGAASTRFTDPEGDTLSYNTLTGLPGTIRFDDTTGTFSGNAPATGTPTITVTVNDGNGGEVEATFTLNLLAAPVPPSETTGMEVAVMEVDPGTDPTAPTSGVAITATDLGFIDENDTRLKSVTFTVPAVTVGVLYRNGVAVTTSSLTLTRAELAAANLRFVPANKKAASTPTIAFSTTGNSGGAITSMLTFTVPASDDAPRVGADILVESAPEGVVYDFTIPDAAINQVDTDDSLVYGAATLADGSALPTWLSFDRNTGTFSGTPAVADRDTLMIRVPVTDAAGKRPGGCRWLHDNSHLHLEGRRPSRIRH